MFEEEEAERYLADHDQWVAAHRQQWDRYRDALSDDYWTDSPGGLFTHPQDNERFTPDGVYVQVNIIRPWLQSYVASLFYRRLTVQVMSDDVLLPGEEPVTPEETESMRRLMDRWLRWVGIEAAWRRAIQQGLLYPNSALMVERDTAPDSPLHRLRLRVLPPWEVLYDRAVSSFDDLAWIGRTYHVHVKDAERKWGEKAVAGMDLNHLPDVVANGLEHLGRTNQDRSYFRVVELYDLKGDGGVRIYAVNPGDRGSGRPGLQELFKGESPYRNAAGRPMSRIIPLVLNYLPERPLDGQSMAKTVYQLATEKNITRTSMANAMRRDVQRILLAREGVLSEQNVADIESGKDGVIVELTGSHPLGSLLQWLEQQPISSTILQYEQVIENDRDDVDARSPTTRGQPLAYASATEVDRLTDYSETTVGLIRSEMDAAMNKVLELYQVALHHEMRVVTKAGEPVEAVRFVDDDQIVTITPQTLRRRWVYALSDTAATPATQQRVRAEFQQTAEQLLNLASIAGNVEQPPEMRIMAQEMLDRLVQLYDLPASFTWSQVSQRAKLLPPPPQPEPLPEQLPAAPAGPTLDGLAAAIDEASI